MDDLKAIIPYAVGFLAGWFVYFVTGYWVVAIPAGIAAWLWCGGRLTTTHWEHEYEKAGRPKLKFKIGDRVTVSDKTGTGECGTVTEISRDRLHFTITWDDDGRIMRWVPVTEQDVYDRVAAKQ